MHCKNHSVSIIIPAYNVQEFIYDSVMSCISQTYKNVIEIIIIDNNSTDSTYQYALDLQKDYPNKIIVDKQNIKGASAARNKGLELAKGDWIQFLDADDILMPNKIKSQIEMITSSQENNLGIIIAPFIKIDSRNISYDFFTKKRNPFLSVALGNIACGITSSNLWLKIALLKVNGFNEKLESSQETNLLFSILKERYTVLFDNTSKTIIRDRNDNSQISKNINEKTLVYNYTNLRKEIVSHIVCNETNFFKDKYYDAKLLYNTLVRRLILLDENDINTKKYKFDMVIFFASNVYKPLELKYISNKKIYYVLQKKIYLIHASKLGFIYKNFIDFIEFKLYNLKLIKNI